MTSPEFQALREALRDNRAQPEGPARNARAERLLADAERIGEPLAVIEALGHQLQVYNYSSEKAKMFVPFSRLLRMWDRDPGDFDAQETYTLHWVFKWVSSGMLDQPHIPLASIEKWLGEMEHRYRLAGHSERAVRQGEFRVARHVGDLDRAARAYTAWLAAERDEMADCHACELHGQGLWQAELGDDEAALAAWAPVLDGQHTCAHEPHAVLASSLLPLLRLGRVEQARANHLRGHRLVRPMESMRGAMAQHIEFCALSGNEGRALELLAERPAYLTDHGDPDSELDFLAVTALLMDRLVARGLGGQRVPGPPTGTTATAPATGTGTGTAKGTPTTPAPAPAREWTAAELGRHARERAEELAARFDARNGSDRVSRLARERMAARPLVDRLPLGVRSGGPSVPAETPTPNPTPIAAPVAPAAPRDLLAEARRLTAERRPEADEAWAALARAEAAGLTDLDALASAELTDHRAMSLAADPVETAALFRAAAEGYEAAGAVGEAWAARARGAYALGEPAAFAEPVAALRGLHGDGGATARQLSGALLLRARVLGTAEAAEEVLGFAGAPDVADRIAEAEWLLGDAAARDGDTGRAAERYERAAELFLEAGLPWYAVEPEARLAALAQREGDLATAERAARAALAHGAGYAGPAGQARLRLRLAEVLGAADRSGEAAEQALEAAHWADEAGESRGLGAYARRLLGGRLLREGRYEEAAAVLEEVLPDLSVEEHGDGAVVQALWWLGDCLMSVAEPRAAAERWLRAAELAAAWPDQRDHATLANLAAQALWRAELDQEAAAAFERAGELWQSLGDIPAYVRTLRVRAWIAGPDARGRALMAAAEEACGGDPRELADTCRQTAELLARAREPDLSEVLAFAERASAGYAVAGDVDARLSADLLTAWLHLDLGDPGAAAELARKVLAADSPEHRAEAAALLARTAPPPPGG
ncbi:tetratricopeptide repeat protein [Streptomyces sp. NPDC093111]|uniref:tetratricopeptide repeat protein n=1 Tax=Streptomyces sp. NPDC093111 TaxID=3154978 RepID=UPI00343E87FF